MRRKGIAVALAVTMGLSGLMTAIPANAEAATEDQQTAYETTEMTDGEDSKETVLVQADGEDIDETVSGQSEDTSIMDETGTLVAINEKNFPDAILRAYLSENYDRKNTGSINADKVKKIYINNEKLTTLKGIELFKNLESLTCSETLLESLDISNNTKLIELNCGKCNISSLDISNNKELIVLRCYNNNLTSLDLSNNTKLEEVDVSHNKLDKLDVSKNPALKILRCHGNMLTLIKNT